MRELVLVLPVYNEAESIGRVITEFVAEFERLGIDYQVYAVNDGSTDASLSIVEGLSFSNQRISVFSQENAGHGPALVKGYKQAVFSARWIFQADSDGEISSKNFERLWLNRDKADFLLGKRLKKGWPWSRCLISFISKKVCFLVTARDIDYNSPFRLMNSAVFRKTINDLRDDLLIPNVAISLFAAIHRVRFYSVDVDHIYLRSGQNVRSFVRFVALACRGLWQLIRNRALFRSAA